MHGAYICVSANTPDSPSLNGWTRRGSAERHRLGRYHRACHGQATGGAHHGYVAQWRSSSGFHAAFAAWLVSAKVNCRSETRKHRRPPACRVRTSGCGVEAKQICDRCNGCAISPGHRAHIGTATNRILSGARYCLNVPCPAVDFPCQGIKARLKFCQEWRLVRAMISDHQIDCRLFARQ
jgi:hypothetical protein